MKGENVVCGHRKGWQEPTHSSEQFTVVDAGNGRIALHCAEPNRFVRLIGADVDARAGVKDVDKLPRDWDSERFVVVDAGEVRVCYVSDSFS